MCAQRGRHRRARRDHVPGRAVAADSILRATTRVGSRRMNRLEGRRILVVGGGQNDFGLDDPPLGNGRAMAILFAQEGAAVAIGDIDGDSAETTARAVEAEGGTAAT